MLIFAIALILLLGGNSECFSPGREHLKEDLLTLNFLGTVEGVSYYVEPNKTMVTYLNIKIKYLLPGFGF